MKIILTKCLCLTAMLTLAAAMHTSFAFTETSKLVIESGNSAQSRQQAAIEKEQWNDTRRPHQKVNKRAGKEWDEANTAFDSRDKCKQSANISTYQESNILRCLDRRTGRSVAP